MVLIFCISVKICISHHHPKINSSKFPKVSCQENPPFVSMCVREGGINLSECIKIIPLLFSSASAAGAGPFNSEGFNYFQNNQVETFTGREEDIFRFFIPIWVNHGISLTNFRPIHYFHNSQFITLYIDTSPYGECSLVCINRLFSSR